MTGKAQNPVYIHLKDGQASIKDAAHLWGKDIYETQEILRKELGDKIGIACIGKAGENQVGFSCVLQPVLRRS